MPDIHHVYRWFFNYFRPRRLEKFRESFPEVMTPIDILDVGGTTYQWDYLKSPANVTILNTMPGSCDSKPDNYRFLQGDGRDLLFEDQSYDLVFSNSVIEHVGDTVDQKAFASELRRVGRMVYCQTPNKWFFVEPHLITVFVHWLPKRVQRRLIRWCSVWGWLAKPSKKEIDRFLDSTRLLTHRELERLFPDCRIERERILGLTKSFVVCRR